MAVIRKYFGTRPEEHRYKNADGTPLSAIADFAKEVAQLTDSDKNELAEGAAAILGEIIED